MTKYPWQPFTIFSWLALFSDPLISYCALSTFLFFLSIISNVHKISYRKYTKLSRSGPDTGEFHVNQLRLGFFFFSSNFVAFSFINGMFHEYLEKSRHFCLPRNVIRYYYTSLSFFLYKNMTVVLLLHPNINCMTIPPVVLVKNYRTIPPLW